MCSHTCLGPAPQVVLPTSSILAPANAQVFIQWRGGVSPDRTFLERDDGTRVEVAYSEAIWNGALTTTAGWIA